MSNHRPPVDCWPPCSPWCACLRGRCLVMRRSINAVRLQTPDGRFLRAVGGSGGGVLVATTVASPGPFETFRFKPPTAWPLASGDPISLELCNATWGFSGLLVRVDHTVRVVPTHKGSPPLVSYEIGGAGAAVFVKEPWSAGYPAYRADDPAEWTFDILKQGVGPIQDGDSVSLRINSNWGNTFFFRVTGPQESAEVDGDGTAQGAQGTVFVATFNEVKTGAGWRPSVVQCQSCAAVTGRVVAHGSGQPIAAATVEALDVLENHPFSATTAAGGIFRLADPEGRICVAAGNIRLRATHERHQTKMIGPVTVPGSGAIDIPIELDCTEVAGILVDVMDRPLAGLPVALLDLNHHPVLDEGSQPYVATTGADGTFVFRCVPHGAAIVWTANDPTNYHVIPVPPEGGNFKIVVQLACGNLVGNVTDAVTMRPIAGATVSLIGGSGTVTTDASGNFLIACVRPAGWAWALAGARGYLIGSGYGIVPMTGNSAPLRIALQPLAVMEITIRLDWGPLPADLDLHASGPDGHGGRYHCYWDHPDPSPILSLDHDVNTGRGPETITIRPTALGTFLAGDYHFWVDNLYGTTYDMSDAAVSVVASGANGVNPLGRFEVVNATGAPPVGGQTLRLWHAVDLAVAADGSVVVHPVQTLSIGDQDTIL
jgi:hypothetical protein